MVFFELDFNGALPAGARAAADGGEWDHTQLHARDDQSAQGPAAPHECRRAPSVAGAKRSKFVNAYFHNDICQIRIISDISYAVPEQLVASMQDAITRNRHLYYFILLLGPFLTFLVAATMRAACAASSSSSLQPWTCRWCVSSRANRARNSPSSATFTGSKLWVKFHTNSCFRMKLQAIFAAKNLSGLSEMCCKLFICIFFLEICKKNTASLKIKIVVTLKNACIRFHPLYFNSWIKSRQYEHSKQNRSRLLWFA